MPTGRVLWLNRGKRYGLVLPGAGKPLLMHVQYSDGRQFSRLVPGLPVRFEVIQTEKGPQAGNVVEL